MFGAEILEVAIGLMFVYLLLSLAVTAANEILAAWFKRRAWMLQKGVSNLINDDRITAAVFSHPLIKGLYEPRSWLSRLPGLRGLFGNGPSYVPAHTFAAAFLDIVAPVTDGKRSLDGLAKTNGELARALSVLQQQAIIEDDKFEKRVEVWFSDSMERVSGWYKRHTQVISLFLALVITLGTNADTLVVAKALWTDPDVRRAVVDRAEQYVRTHQPSTEIEATDDDAAPPPPMPPDKQAEADFVEASSDLQSALADLNELQLPLGWDVPNPAPASDSATAPRLVPDDQRDDWPGRRFWEWDTWARWWEALKQHLFGWLFTVMAISLGAPFWFDTLNKIVSIRSAGKAPEEAQKSPKEVPKPQSPGK